MIFFPAIDLKDGKCVRLIQGDMATFKIFDESPINRAKLFLKEGCSWLHIVDLNGAFKGKPINTKAIKEIIKNVNINIQLGGGIRDIETIDFWVDLGVNRIVLGTVALKNPEIVKEACKKHYGKIAIGLDTREGLVAVEGWAEQSKVKALDLVKQYEDYGVSTIIYTDIKRDGILRGPAAEGTAEFAEKINIPVIVSGGVSSIEDLIKIKGYEESGIVGVICGRAIYDNRLNIRDGIKALENNAKN